MSGDPVVRIIFNGPLLNHSAALALGSGEQTLPALAPLLVQNSALMEAELVHFTVPYTIGTPARLSRRQCTKTDNGCRKLLEGKGSAARSVDAP